jgi:hypothetical protein
VTAARRITLSTLSDWLRAGALTAGVATLLAVWWRGLDQLGYIEWPNGFGSSFVIIFLVSVAFGVTLGHVRPSPLWARAIAALAVGSAFGALLIGSSFLLVKHLGIPERSLPPYFLLMAVALVAWGMRRLPAGRGARVALIVMFALLASFRVVASIPRAAHGIERFLFPISTARIRAASDKRGCGSFCEDGRARVVDFRDQLSYETAGHQLEAVARVHTTLETTKVFFVDGCGRAHATPPVPSASVREYPSTKACASARRVPRGPEEMILPEEATLDGHAIYRACCAIESTERRAGGRFTSTRVLHFIFLRGHWQEQGEQ